MQPEPTCWRVVTGSSSAAATLRPDLFVSVGAGDLEHRWFVEIDLGSEHLPTLLRKCQQYEAYYQSGTEQAEHGVFPKVLWIMHNQDRAKRLTDAVQIGTRLTTELFVATTTDHAIAALIGGTE